MSTVLVGSYPIGAIHVGLSGTVGLIGPLLAQVDLMLFGPFGLGAFKADLQAQLSASLALSVNVPDYVAILKQKLATLLQLQASIAAHLDLKLPLPSISASAALSGALSLRISGLGLLIKLALQLKIPLVNFLAQLNLSAGPVLLITVGFAAPSTLASSAGEYAALVGGPGGIGGIMPWEPVHGIMLLTKDPGAVASLSLIMKTS